jgi:hypothetical protein
LHVALLHPFVLHEHVTDVMDVSYNQSCWMAGNDFSTLYAPLIRDGRMEKYYWNPTREDRIGVCFGIFKDDNLDRSQIEYLVDTFPAQSIDFFGALRARVYDNAVREFIEDKGLEGLGKNILASTRTGFEFPVPSMDLVRPSCSLRTLHVYFRVFSF